MVILFSKRSCDSFWLVERLPSCPGGVEIHGKFMDSSIQPSINLFTGVDLMRFCIASSSFAGYLLQVVGLLCWEGITAIQR